MKLDDSYMDHTLMEHYETCPRECYSYEFVTGAFRTYVGTKEWVWGHSEPIDDWNRIDKQIKDEIAFAKRHPHWWRFKFLAHVAWLRTWGRITFTCRQFFRPKVKTWRYPKLPPP